MSYRPEIQTDSYGETQKACRFCGELVELDYDGETGLAQFPNYHFWCGQPKTDGRFIVEGRRYATALAATEWAQYLADNNHRHSFIVWDLETGELVGRATMDKEERRRRFYEYDRSFAVAVGMPLPAHPIGGMERLLEELGQPV